MDENYLRALSTVQISLKYRNDEDARHLVDTYSSFLPEEASRLQRIYHFKYSITSVPKCAFCDSDRKFGRTIYYMDTCGSKKCWGLQKSKTYMNKSEHEKSEIKSATKKTMLDKYGRHGIANNIMAGAVSKAENATMEELKTLDISFLCRVYKNSELIKIRVDAETKNIDVDGVSQRIYHFKFGGEPLKCGCGKNCQYGNNGRYRSTCGGKGCIVKHRETTCLSKYGSNNITRSGHYLNIKAGQRFEKYEKIIHPDSIIELGGYYFKCKCHTCGSEYQITQHLARQRKNLYHTKLCTICNPIGVLSGKANEIIEFVKSRGINDIKINDRTIIRPEELDIYCPDKNVAIEFNGTYWHSEFFKDRMYHARKTVRCENLGVRLIHVWEDDWKFKRPIVESVLLSVLGLTPIKFNARDCEVREMSHHDAALFLDDNHLQGACPSSVRLGLYHAGAPVSIMTFGRARRALGMELLRFCSRIGHVVRGASSMLFATFLRMCPHEEHVFSYADASRYDGGVYEHMGFSRVSSTAPNYWYIVDGKRRHRFGFRKDVLVREGYDPNKTEHDIMLGRGIPRLYDCGSTKFEYHRSV